MHVRESQRIHIPLDRPVRSLCWDGDTLIDWAGGGFRFELDASRRRERTIYYPYRFDRALVLPGTAFSILYENTGTKGLVLEHGENLRELNRSYYHANVYEYPITCFRLPDGTPALAHCPDEYNKLEIEELSSGRRLTTRTSESVDFFHSRLQVNATGEYLISAGWVWHPLDAVQIFRVPDVVRNPALLDEYSPLIPTDDLFEVNTVAFQTDKSLIYTGADDSPSTDPSTLAVFDLESRKTIFEQKSESIPGTLMPVGPDHIIGFFESPKLFETRTGKVILTWPDLKTGKQNSSIIHHHERVPALALDPSHLRFAVATDVQITVIQLVF